MKKLLTLLAFLAGPLLLLGQTEVSLEFKHFLGDRPFELDLESTNNIGHDFRVTRLQYYVSEISLIHDGGQITPATDVHLLVNATVEMKINIGSYPINELERVEFHIGVQENKNHLDPATYPPDHPLAPQFPSMHWGWAGGYRFIAYEGYGGKTYNQQFQLHGLGDVNYFKTGVDLPLKAQNGGIDIVIHADYAKGLDDIKVNNGVIVHGETHEAKTALENFRDHVFSAPEITSSSRNELTQREFRVYPNPSASAMANVDINLPNELLVNLEITDISGRAIYRQTGIRGNASFQLRELQAGLYLVRVLKDEKTIGIRKLIVQ